MKDLHDSILDIRATPDKTAGANFVLAYKIGHRDARHAAAELAIAATAPTAEDAHAMGAKGAPATESERLLFEAWMRGHCWAVIGDWTGKTYTHKHESTGFVHAGAMDTRRMWAAWRDRAALSTPQAQPAIKAELTEMEIRDWWSSDNGLEDCDMCKYDDFEKVVRAVLAAQKAKS